MPTSTLQTGPVDINSMIQTVIFALTMFAAIYAARWAKRIGSKQNEIDTQLLEAQRQSLEAQTFVELSVSPLRGPDHQMEMIKMDRGNGYVVHTDILIKAIGVYPIYINEYVLVIPSTSTIIVETLGAIVIPSDGYIIQIPTQAYPNKTFDLTVKFEDHLGKKYNSVHHCYFRSENGRWKIESEKKSSL
jgi:hypothetical protein